jgi:hypothetical protein
MKLFIADTLLYHGAFLLTVPKQQTSNLFHFIDGKIIKFFYGLGFRG